jgi:hypothetical protein
VADQVVSSIVHCIYGIDGRKLKYDSLNETALGRLEGPKGNVKKNGKK